MRITETRMLELMGRRTMDTQSDLATASGQVSSGIEVDRPSADPVRWADGMRTKLTMDRRDTHESTVARARDNLNRADVALADVFDRLAEVRDLAILGSSDTYSAEARTAAALEVSQLFDSMLTSVNAQSVDGEYLLSGSNSDVPPFDTTGTYQGNDVIREIEVSTDVRKQASVPGSYLTAAQGVDVFALVAQVEAELAANDPDAVRDLLDDLGVGLEQVALARTEAGVASSSLEQSLDTLSALELSLTESLENSVSADAIESATWFANLSNQLEASRAVSERIVSLMSIR